MTTRRFLAAIATTAVVLASCSNGEETSDPPTENIGPTATPEPGDPTSAAPTTTPVATTTSEPTSEPTPTIDEVEAANEDEQAVIDTAKTFVEVIEPEVLRDPASDASIIDEWATGQARESTMSDVEYTRSQDERLVGEVTLTVLDVVVTQEGATLEACLDPLGADYVNANGESVLVGNRFASVISMTLVPDSDKELGWVITENRAGGMSCSDW